MKILYITQSSFNTPCAETSHVFEITSNLQRVGNEIKLLIPSGRKVDVANDIEVMELIIPGPRKLQIIFFQFVLFFRLLLLQKQDYDIFMVRMSSIMIAPLLISKIKRIPLVLEVNGLGSIEVPIHYPNNKIILSFLLPIIQTIEKTNFRGASLIFTVTKMLQEKVRLFLDADKQKNVHLITNGANLNHFYPYQASREKFGYSPSDFIVGFVGGLYPWMGIDTIFNASKILKNKSLDIKFVIVGGGKDTGKYMERAKLEEFNQVKLLGPVIYEKIPEIINIFNVCTAPYDGTERNTKMGMSSIKIFEYMACGKGVVVSRLPGINDFIEQEDVGLAIEPDNPEELASAIEKLFLDRELLSELGRKGRSMVEKKYSWYVIAEQINNIILKHKESNL